MCRFQICSNSSSTLSCMTRMRSMAWKVSHTVALRPFFSPSLVCLPLWAVSLEEGHLLTTCPLRILSGPVTVEAGPRPHLHPGSGAEVAAEAMPSPSASPDVLTLSLLPGWKQTQRERVAAPPALGETAKGGGSCIIISFHGRRGQDTEKSHNSSWATLPVSGGLGTRTRICLIPEALLSPPLPCGFHERPAVTPVRVRLRVRHAGRPHGGRGPVRSHQAAGTGALGHASGCRRRIRRASCGETRWWQQRPG